MEQGRINYGQLLQKYPWIVEKKLNCVISPDADGMLCGLFMSHHLGWDVVGYYDNGKNLFIKKGVNVKECVFLDTEIYRKNIRSIGHHISLLRKDNTDVDLSQYQNCINPNNMRGRTLREAFRYKYPIGTIHLLLCIVGHAQKVEHKEKSFFAILQADGAINRFVDRYSENLRDWLLYLGIDNPENILNKILQKETNLIDLNKEYVLYVQRFVKNRADKIPISMRGEIVASSFTNNNADFSKECIDIIENYLKFLSGLTGWNFKKDKWAFGDLILHRFIKKIVRPGVGTYNAAVKDKFLSLAITANDTMEYTIGAEKVFPLPK